MYLAIIMLPLLGSIISGFFGRKIGVTGSQILTSVSIIITTILSVLAFFEVGFNNISVQLTLCRWLDSELINVSWGFNFDSLTVSMLIPVLFISSLVHIYSIGYMDHDPHNQRFFSYLSLFTFMMIILVTADNFLLMFVGWEGVGVCSYLLVSFWFTRIAANQSSMSAFLTNRVGDCFLTLGMFALLLTFGNLDYTTIFSLTPFISESNISIIGICLLIGAMAKSSQIGLHVWLPLAMEGPTPVSALIHAATMVTAGVYLLMRSSPLIEYSSTVLVTALWIGSVTTVFSSLIGLFQQDIKKVIAYSTMSQLGMMVIAIGLSSYNLALFHLINHAFYKGLLFLAAGAVIHAISDNQDFRKYGGLILFLPLSYTVMLIASLSLVAFPFMTGFYSKDFILESSFAQYTYSSIAVYFTALIGAVFTTLYSVKVLYLTFISKANSSITNYNKAHEGNIFMSFPLVILALFSIFFGYFTKDIFIGLGSGLFADNSIFIHPIHEIAINSEFAVPHTIKLLPLFLTLFMTALSMFILEFFPYSLVYVKFTRIGYNVFSLLNLRFLFEFIYNRFVTYFLLNLGGQTTKILDKGSIEKLGPYGLENMLINLSRNLSKLDTGVVTSYALYILIGFLLYISVPYVFHTSQDILLLIIYCATIYVIKKDKNYSYNMDKIPNVIPKPHYIVKSDVVNYGLIVGVVYFAYLVCADVYKDALSIVQHVDMTTTDPTNIKFALADIANEFAVNTDGLVDTTSNTEIVDVNLPVDSTLSSHSSTVMGQDLQIVDKNTTNSYNIKYWTSLYTVYTVDYISDAIGSVKSGINWTVNGVNSLANENLGKYAALFAKICFWGGMSVAFVYYVPLCQKVYFFDLVNYNRDITYFPFAPTGPVTHWLLIFSKQTSRNVPFDGQLQHDYPGDNMWNVDIYSFFINRSYVLDVINGTAWRQVVSGGLTQLKVAPKHVLEFWGHIDNTTYHYSQYIWSILEIKLDINLGDWFHIFQDIWI